MLCVQIFLVDHGKTYSNLFVSADFIWSYYAFRKVWVSRWICKVAAHPMKGRRFRGVHIILSDSVMAPQARVSYFDAALMMARVHEILRRRIDTWTTALPSDVLSAVLSSKTRDQRLSLHLREQ